MMDGISIQQMNSAVVCRINNFSDELKKEIRDRLSIICHGPDAVTAERIFSSYKRTLEEFNKRYENKSENTKKGWIGELLIHILLFKTHAALEPASRFFNMEEGNTKKGFDLIVYDNELDQIWITEVKSGATNDGANRYNKSLINKAKNDLKTRLRENETNHWLNAINGARIALSEGKEKEKINLILEECYEEAAEERQESSSKNVILASVVYKNTDDPIAIKDVAKKCKEIIDEKLFKNVVVFSIQKETYHRIAEFLVSEAGS